jgi:hypothetical protein
VEEARKKEESLVLKDILNQVDMLLYYIIDGGF